MNTEITTTSLTHTEAEEWLERIQSKRQAVYDKVARDLQDIASEIAGAYTAGIWIALGYPSGIEGWAQFRAEQFNDQIIGPRPEDRNALISNLHQQGLSQRAISAAVGTGLGTVNRTLASTGVPDGTPANVQGADGKRYAASRAVDKPEIEDAEIIDEGELHQPTAAPRTTPASVAPQAAPAEPSTQYRDVDELDAGDLGVEPMSINTNGHAPQIEAETVKRIIREYHLSGSSDTAQIKKTAGELRSYLESGMVDPAAWDEDELSILAEDSADVVVAICDLLLVMAEGGQTRGTASIAVQDSELVETLPVIKTKVDALDQALDRTPARV